MRGYAKSKSIKDISREWQAVKNKTNEQKALAYDLMCACSFWSLMWWKIKRSTRQMITKLKNQ